MPIIEKLDAVAKERTEDASLAVIDQNQVVHMAHMDIHFSHSTNGVATLHTQILKESELDFIICILRNSTTKQMVSPSVAGSSNVTRL